MQELADLGSARCTLADAETNENRVSHLHQNVVNTVHMQILDARLNHFIQQFVLTQSLV